MNAIYLATQPIQKKGSVFMEAQDEHYKQKLKIHFNSKRLKKKKGEKKGFILHIFLFWVLMYNTLFPLRKASPYLFFSCPLTYSSVCSTAMFM
uniref:Uncharacterized protein n=1 Tax=Anguilla anguilla TaxID=7936 RepID=A0A0E9WAX2_ANGAN